MRIVLVTCPPGVGLNLLRSLVTERLVAGGNLIPGIRSIYQWKGTLCEEQEEILLMETWESRVDGLIERIKSLHPYEVPKILTFEPREGWPEYLAWVHSETHGGSASDSSDPPETASGAGRSEGQGE